MKQSVDQRGTDHLDVVGEIEPPFERAPGDAAMQVNPTGFVGLLAADHQLLVLDRTDLGPGGLDLVGAALVLVVVLGRPLLGLDLPDEVLLGPHLELEPLALALEMHQALLALLGGCSYLPNWAQLPSVTGEKVLGLVTPYRVEVVQTAGSNAITWDDIIELYRQFPAQSRDSLINEAKARGKLLADQANRVANANGRVIVATIFDVGLKTTAELVVYTCFRRQCLPACLQRVCVVYRHNRVVAKRWILVQSCCDATLS